MHLAQPGWLLLLLLLPLLAVGAILIARLRKKRWQPFVAPRLRSALLKRSGTFPRWLAFFLLLAALAVMAGALSRPQGDAGTTTEQVLGRNILIALDISRSMLVSDVKPDRLSQAKIIIYEMLETMPEDRIGLIGFAGSAFLHAPLTIDHAAVRETVEQIHPDWATMGGSDLAAALRLAITTLKETGQKNNALVFISDGEHHEGDLPAMIREAESSGVYIFAIGVGTEDGGFVPPRESPGGRWGTENEVLSRLQPEVMRKLATDTGGRYALAGSAMDIPAMVRSATQDLDSFEMQGRERRVMFEFYQWLLLPGILFLGGSILAGTRWRGMRAATVLAVSGFFLGPAPARADTPSSAREALKEQRYEEARDSYRKLAESTRLDGRAARFRLGEGSAAYHAGDYRGARSAYSEALRGTDPEVISNGHLGLGNSLFQLGWQGLSGESYPGDPEQIPDLDRFDTLVRERLAKLAEGEVPDSGETEGFTRIDSMIVNWADAVRHYESSLELSPSNEAAARNRETTMTYLRRLRELMEEEKDEAEESMPQPGEGEPQPGEPGEGEGEPEEGEGEGQGGGEEGEPGEGSGDENENEEGSGDGDEETEDGNEGEGEEEDPNDGSDGDGDSDPNESPEDRARRILRENADLERGRLRSGRRDFMNPEKDW